MADVVREGAGQLHPFAGKIRQVVNPQNVNSSTKTPEAAWPYDIWADLWNESVWDGYSLPSQADGEKRSLVGWVLDTNERVRSVEAKLDAILKKLEGK